MGEASPTDIGDKHPDATSSGALGRTESTSPRMISQPPFFQREQFSLIFYVECFKWLDLLEITVPESTVPACEEDTLDCCQCPLGPGDVRPPFGNAFVHFDWARWTFGCGAQAPRVSICYCNHPCTYLSLEKYHSHLMVEWGTGLLLLVHIFLYQLVTASCSILEFCLRYYLHTRHIHIISRSLAILCVLIPTNQDSRFLSSQRLTHSHVSSMD